MILRKLAPAGAAAILGAALTLAGASIAAASGSGTARHAASTPAATRVTAASLCQNLWAVVASDGSLSRAGCPGTTSAVDGTGFVVKFPRSIVNCAYLANLGLGGSGLEPPAGMASTTRVNPGTLDTVFVQTWNTAGDATHQAFHLAVDCAPASRSGMVRISAPHRSATISVPHGLSAASVVLATAQNNVGVSVVSAVPDRQRGRVTIHLSQAPRHGHPVIVGWSVVN